MGFRFLVAALLVGAALATPTASAELAEVAEPADLRSACFQEPDYPTHPDYSGGFCFNGGVTGDCIIDHYWNDQHGSGWMCYVPGTGAVADVDAASASLALFYKCIDEPHYPTHPNYSGGFCIDGQLGADCPVSHYWTDAQGSDEICYTDAVSAAADFAAPASATDGSPVLPYPPCVEEPPYPTHPSYSGGFCLSEDRSCTIYHYWTQDGESHNECYVGPSASGPLDVVAASSIATEESVLIPPPKCVREPSYPTHPDYAGGYCVYWASDCHVYHYWTEDGEPGRTCYA